MSHINPQVLVVAVLGLAFASGGPASTEQGPSAVEQRVAALKQSLQESQAQLRKYEWVETTIVSFKGEEKDRKQQRCYYGADGTVEKILLDEQKAAPPSGGRLKRKIVASKKEGMKEYMESAGSLIQRYAPPNPADIDSAKKREKVALRPGQGGRVRVEFTDYIQPGDLMAVDVDTTANRLVGLSVNELLRTQSAWPLRTASGHGQVQP